MNEYNEHEAYEPIVHKGPQLCLKLLSTVLICGISNALWIAYVYSIKELHMHITIISIISFALISGYTTVIANIHNIVITEMKKNLRDKQSAIIQLKTKIKYLESVKQ